MSWIAANWQILLGLIGMSGLGGLGLRALSLWSQHQKILIEGQHQKRKQTDDAVMAANSLLTARLAVVEARDETCHASLEGVRVELGNVKGMLRSTVRALRFAPADKHETILSEVAAELEERDRGAGVPIGDLRNRVQAELSASRVVRDAQDGKM